MTIQAIDEASGVMGKISASMGLIGSELETLGPGFSQLGQLIQGFAIAGPTGAAIVGLGEIVKGMQDSVTAAASLQTAWTNLQAVMHLTGDAWTTMKNQVDALVESLRTTTTFSDTDLISAFQSLVTYGMSSAQAMQSLGAAVELAAAKHIDLTTAANALGKAFDGNAMLLRRYGVETATVTQETSLGTEAIKELGVNLLIATGTQLTTFTAAMADAGLAVETSTGKMMDHAAILKEITDAWKGGTIDATQLSAIVGVLGINFQSGKALAMDYANVLGQVNTQYGGTAQAQATTYAGLQERLGNAVQELGEKIGTILLPALSSILEALIPLVDAFGKAVPAVEGFFAAIGKLPAIQGTINAFQSIWNGLTKSFDDAWTKVSGDFTPAIQQLMDAFTQLNTALQPLWDAFNELWKAITGSGSDFNLFQAILETIVAAIKGLADIITFVTPAIHLLAEAFKAAADFIVPILTTLRNVIGGFIDWLTSGFQAFYDWLVGHSLWTDLWDAILSIALGASGKIIAQVAASLFVPLQAGFSQAIANVQTTWNAGLEGVKSALSNAITVIATKNPELAAVLDVGLSILSGKWSDAFTKLGVVASDEFSNISSATGKFLGDMASALSNAWNSMINVAQSAFNELGSLVNSAMASIAQAANNLWNTLTQHSIWPDMMAEMVAQTAAGMAAVQNEFQSGFESPTGIIQTVQAGGKAIAAATSGPAAAPAAPQPGQAITLPINVYLDGQQIQTIMEKRLVSTIYRDANRSKRGTT